VEFGGLARSDVAGGFEEGFAALAAALAAAHGVSEPAADRPAHQDESATTSEDRK